EPRKRKLFTQRYDTKSSSYIFPRAILLTAYKVMQPWLTLRRILESSTKEKSISIRIMNILKSFRASSSKGLYSTLFRPYPV
ncbi:hypothetical protein TorRG33x02_336680, partial [Trema orientale]